MDISTLSKSVKLNFPLHRVSVNNTTQTVEVFSGMLFPTNKKIILCGLNFGDSGTVYNIDPINALEYNSMVSVISSVEGFLPSWSDSLSSNAEIITPKFRFSYRYSKPGKYRIRCSLMDENNTVYIGNPISVEIYPSIAKKVSQPGDPPPPQLREEDFTVPIRNTWELISDELTPAIDSDGYHPSITSNYTPPSSTSLPFTVDLDLSLRKKDENLFYVRWEANSELNQTLSYLTYPEDAVKFRTSYPLLPLSKQIRTNATIVYGGEGIGLSYTTSRVIELKNWGNIAISRQATGKGSTDPNLLEGIEENNIVLEPQEVDSFLYNDPLHDICAVPSTSSTIPVRTRFYFKYLPGLKLILCDFDDGSYDVIPASSYRTRNNVAYITASHLYSSVNHTDFYPVFTYIFERDDGTFYAARRTLTTRLHYGLGVFEQAGNHKIIPISSSTNFRKFNCISTTVQYIPDTKNAYLFIRLAVGTNSRHILSFDKIVWNINGKGVVQDKDTSPRFGYLTEVVRVPASQFRITASLYRKNQNTALANEFYDFYDGGIFNILSEEDSIVQNKKLKIISQQREFNPAVPLPAIEDFFNETTSPLTKEEEQREYLDNLSTEAYFRGTEVVFDKAITAEAPAANFLNRNYPTIAAKESEEYQTNEQVGFFKPSKTSLAIVDPGAFTFFIDVPSIDIYRPYYFPDPFKYGSETSSLIFNVDQSSFRKGIGFGNIKNFPNTTETSISYNGYTSTPTTRTATLQDLSGNYIADKQQDIYNNSFALVKGGEPFTKSVKIISPEIQQNLNVNGYALYDVMFNSGSNYDYSIEGTFGNVIRTGITTSTEHLSSNNTRYTTLNFGRLNSRYSFSPAKQPLRISTQYLNPVSSEEINCGVFADISNDFISSDRIAFPGSYSDYYYTELYEAGANQSTPYTRPVPEISSFADFTQSLFLSNTGTIVDVDCGMFYTNYSEQNDKTIHAIDTYVFNFTSADVQTVYTQTTSYPASIIKRKKQPGQIIITNNRGEIYNIQDLEFNKNRYGSTVFNELSSVVSFNVVYDKLFIQTGNYFIIDKISYASFMFKKPTAIKHIYQYNNTPFNKISNRLKVDDYVYFVITDRFDTKHKKQTYIIPNVYRYNIKTESLLQLFPTTPLTELDSRFNVSDARVEFVEVDTPTITFSKRTNKINLSYLLKDQNKSPAVVSLMFDHDSVIRFKESAMFKIVENGSTVSFNKYEFNATITATPTISSQQPTHTESYLVL